MLGVAQVGHWTSGTISARLQPAGSSLGKVTKFAKSLHPNINTPPVPLKYIRVQNKGSIWYQGVVSTSEEGALIIVGVNVMLTPW